MWKNTLLVLAVLGTTLGATIHHCSDASCLEEQLETDNFEFLEKFTQKQFRSIVNLTMVNASVNKVDPRLKYLKNLSYLDLSHNNIQITSLPTLYKLKTLILRANSLKNINMTALPLNIEVLDISQNLLTHIPKDWRSLKSLKTLHLYKNPIDCNCDNGNVVYYQQLMNSSVEVPGSVNCHSPIEFKGKDVSSVSCSFADMMFNDQPEEGSGSSDIFTSTEEGTNIPLVEEEEDEDVIEENTIIDDKIEDEILDVTTTINSVTEDVTLGDEGSGDEGSGDIVMIGCIVNCTPPGPVGADDGEFDSPPPSMIDQARIILNDINPFKEEVTTASTATTTTGSTTLSLTTSTTTVAPSKALPVEEPIIFKETERKLEKSSDKNEEVEMISNSTNTAELENASVAPKDSTAVYAIIGAGLFLGVLFLIAFLKNRKTKRRQNKNDIPNALGEEMKPLSKLPITTINEKPNRKSNIPENVPLINGQNGKTKDDTPKLTSFTPLAHPELPRNGKSNAEEPTVENGHFNDADEVEIRPKTQTELLTPQRERVTIRESEIPDSIPKTPILIQRQKNSDGEIITTVVP